MSNRTPKKVLRRAAGAQAVAIREHCLFFGLLLILFFTGEVWRYVGRLDSLRFLILVVCAVLVAAAVVGLGFRRNGAERKLCTPLLTSMPWANISSSLSRCCVDDTWTSAPNLPALTGAEAFIGLNATVQDFWRFALSDLRMNNTRGYLAEFVVAKAVGATTRVEWDAYDVLAPSGARIEVESSAYLEVWEQRRPSRISFSGLTGRTWSPQGGESPTATYSADVCVFACRPHRPRGLRSARPLPVCSREPR